LQQVRPNPRIVLVGSVASSFRTLEALIRNGANLVGVAGLAQSMSPLVSGYARMESRAASAGIPYFDFERINVEAVYRSIEGWAPDLLFVVGLSQIVKRSLLSLPTMGCVGFHPTWLPMGRGRAPLAWLVLDGKPGAATFFLMNEDIDAGPILVQEPFFVAATDYAGEVEQKMLNAIDRGLDRWIPRLRAGEWQPEPQHGTGATYNGARRPEDGLIRWDTSARDICSLIRATSRPHPGAHTYVAGARLIIWRANVVTESYHRGVVGRIIKANAAGHLLVQTGDGLICLTEYEVDGVEDVVPRLAPGVKLGYEPQCEIHRLNHMMTHLAQQVAELRRMLDVKDDHRTAGDRNATASGESVP